MYTKLFASILNSSIWSEDAETCKIWITLLAMMDRRGYIFGSVIGIAKIAALSLPVAQKAMDRFLSPDPHSGDHSRNNSDGRRIEIIPGGWRVINADYYRETFDEDERRERNKIRMREKRAQERAHLCASVRAVSQSESESESESESVRDKAPSEITKEAEKALEKSIKANKAEDEAQGGRRKEAPTLAGCKLLAVKSGMPESEGEKFFHFYESKGWKVGKTAMRSIGGAMGGWACRWRDRQSPKGEWQPGSGNL